MAPAVATYGTDQPSSRDAFLVAWHDYLPPLMSPIFLERRGKPANRPLCERKTAHQEISSEVTPPDPALVAPGLLSLFWVPTSGDLEWLLFWAANFILGLWGWLYPTRDTPKTLKVRSRNFEKFLCTEFLTKTGTDWP